MPTLREQIDTYLQEMLKMQYIVSKDISHSLTKGELRERFVKRMVEAEFQGIILKSGILCAGDWQSTQADFLWLRNRARIGRIPVFDLEDCRMFMEIKSCATAAEIKAINTTALDLKERYSEDEPLSVGMFCYRTVAKERTILKKFGFIYDRDIESYTYSAEDDDMPGVDFLFSLNIAEEAETNTWPYLIARDRSGGCTLYKDNPVIKYFLNYFQ